MHCTLVCVCSVRPMSFDTGHVHGVTGSRTRVASNHCSSTPGTCTESRALVCHGVRSSNAARDHTVILKRGPRPRPTKHARRILNAAREDKPHLQQYTKRPENVCMYSVAVLSCLCAYECFKWQAVTHSRRMPSLLAFLLGHVRRWAGDCTALAARNHWRLATTGTGTCT